MQVGGKKGSTTYIGNLNLCGGSFFGCVLLQQPPSKINDKCPQLTTDMYTLYGNTSTYRKADLFSALVIYYRIFGRNFGPIVFRYYKQKKTITYFPFKRYVFTIS